MKAYRCKHCQQIHQEKPKRCRECNYPELEEISLLPKEYCNLFGHDGGTRRIPNTAKAEGQTWVAYEEDDIAIGGSYETIYSHEYEFKCARCGHTKRYRA